MVEKKDGRTYYQQSPPYPEINAVTSHWNPQADVFPEFVRIDVCPRLMVWAIPTGQKRSQQILNDNKSSWESIGWSINQSINYRLDSQSSFPGWLALVALQAWEGEAEKAAERPCRRGPGLTLRPSPAAHSPLPEPSRAPGRSWQKRAGRQQAGRPPARKGWSHGK